MTYNGPFLPYTHHAIQPEDEWALGRALHSAHLTQGKEVEAFEAELCAETGAKYAVAVSSGTAALHCLYAYFRDANAVVFASGKRVRMPAISFVATANMAVAADFQRFAPLRFEDVVPTDDFHGLLNVWASVGGDIPKLMPAEILDLAHALGTPVDFSAILGATYSFHPAKHITTGEGGAVCTNREDVADFCRVFRSHGRQDGRMVQFGMNYRLPDLNAALGRAQLARLHWSIDRRRTIAAKYDEAFKGLPCTPVPHSPRSARHLYQILTPHRNALQDALRARGIGTAIHYPPIPLEPWWAAQGGYTASQFPLACAWADRVLALPLYPTLTDADVRRVITAVQEECR